MIKTRIIQIDNIKNELSLKKGLYIWFDKIMNYPVYIGIAIGQGGLKKRISQHLNPKYLEFRPEKHSSNNSYQIRNAIIKRSKNNKISKGIDKSVFRKSIGREHNIKPGIETVKYIKNNFRLEVYESENINTIRMNEKKLIQKYNPKYNSSYKVNKQPNNT